MKKLTYSLLILIFLFFSACDSRIEMKTFFENAKVLTDKQGREYLVEHHIGNVYTITPIPFEDNRPVLRGSILIK